MHQKTKDIVVNLCLTIGSIIFFLAIMELTFSYLFRYGNIEKFDSDKQVLGDRVVASMQIDPDLVKFLQFPVNGGGEHIILDTSPKGHFKSLMAIEYYADDVINRVENSVSLGNEWYTKYYTAEKQQEIYPDVRSFLDHLIIAAKKKKVIITIGGSTTAWSSNWPYFLARKLEQAAPGEYLVFNLGQPGDISWGHYTKLKNIVLPILDKENIKPYAIVALDGVNDMLLPLYQDMYYEAKALSGSCIECSYQKDEIKHEALYPSYEDINKGTAIESIEISSIAEDIFYVLPYTSTYLWRLIAKSKVNVVLAKEKEDSPRVNPNEPIKSFAQIRKDIKPFNLGEHPRLLDQALSKYYITDENGKKTLRFGESKLRRFERYFTTGIDNLLKISEQRNIPLYYFLQPVALQKYYSLVEARIQDRKEKGAPLETYVPDLNSCLDSVGVLGMKQKGVFTDFEPLYTRYQNLFSDYKKKGYNFYDISGLFKNITDIKDDIYSGDAIHYGLNGSEAIANKIYNTIDSKLEE